MFVGSDRGGDRAALFYTLIETALCRARHRAVYADRRTMPSTIWRGLISVGPVGVQLGVVHRPCDRPLANGVKRLH